MRLVLFGGGPCMACLLDSLPLSCRSNWIEAGRRPCWVPGIVAGMLILVVAGISLGGFDAANGRSLRLATLNRQPCSSRLFHEQDWGGLIEAECRPARPTYLDDRTRFTARNRSSNTSMCSPAARHGTPCATFRDRIDLVWVKPDRGLAKRMLKEPGSAVLTGRGSVLFGRERVWVHWQGGSVVGCHFSDKLSSSRTALVSSSWQVKSPVVGLVALDTRGPIRSLPSKVRDRDSVEWISTPARYLPVRKD